LANSPDFPEWYSTDCLGDESGTELMQPENLNKALKMFEKCKGRATSTFGRQIGRLLSVYSVIFQKEQ
jgi:hypothetical protein